MMLGSADDVTFTALQHCMCTFWVTVVGNVVLLDPFLAAHHQFSRAQCVCIFSWLIPCIGETLSTRALFLWSELINATGGSARKKTLQVMAMNSRSEQA